MNSYHIGDQSRALSMRIANTTIKQKIDALGKEMVSGKKNDLAKALDGKLYLVNSLDNRVKEISSYQSNLQNLSLTLSGMQASIQSIENITGHLAPALLAAAGNGSPENTRTLISEGASQLDSVINLLNSKINDRYIFSGTRADNPPLVSAEEMISLITLDLPEPASADEILFAVDSWFSEGTTTSNFFQNGYQGSLSNEVTVPIGGSNVTIKASAKDEGFQSVLKGLITLNIANDRSHYLPAHDIEKIASQVGSSLSGSVTQVSETRSHLAILEYRVENQKNTLSAESDALTLTLSNIATTDPYEAAASILESITAMQNIYMLTSRISKLSLSNYLS